MNDIKNPLENRANTRLTFKETAKPAAPPVKKKSRVTTFFLYLILPLIIAAAVTVYFVIFDNRNVKAQADDKDTSARVLAEIGSEQKIMDDEKQRLDDYERNLKAYESELDRKYTDYLLKVKDLQDREDALNKKIESLTVDRQTIETYENIDPEQAAILLKNLFNKDSKLTILLMRKLSGKKAGKILEAMIPIDAETSALLAKETMDYFKNKQ